MKKILLFFAMMVTVTAGYAQDDKQCCGQDGDKAKAPTTEQITQAMIDNLNLDKEQAIKLKALNEEYAEVLQGPGPHHGGPHRGAPRHGMRRQQQGDLQQAPAADQQRMQRRGAPREDGQQLQGGGETKHGKMHAKREEYERKLNEILTPEQQEKLRSSRPAPRGHMQMQEQGRHRR